MKKLIPLFLIVSFSSFGGELSPFCQAKILKALGTRTIKVSEQVEEQIYHYSIAPFVGPVCSEEGSLTVTTVDGKTTVRAIVNPWAALGSERSSCQEQDLTKYPVNTISVENECDLTLIGLSFDIDMQD